MKTVCRPNLDRRGRWLRGFLAVLLLAGGAVGFFVSPWLGLILAGPGAFVLFEALRGWCALRACGVKTRW
jgi:hypothetical protein